MLQTHGIEADDVHNHQSRQGKKLSWCIELLAVRGRLPVAILHRSAIASNIRRSRLGLDGVRHRDMQHHSPAALLPPQEHDRTLLRARIVHRFQDAEEDTTGNRAQRVFEGVGLDEDALGLCANLLIEQLPSRMINHTN